eukprot:SAG31_NODE_1086_length_9998_cov_2.389837_2_plen_333_part_00
MVEWDRLRAEVGGSLLVAQGIDFCVAAAEKDTLDAATNKQLGLRVQQPQLPALLALSFGMVTLAIGFGLPTRVIGMHAAAPVFMLYTSGFCCLAGWASTFQVSVTALIVLCWCLTMVAARLQLCTATRSPTSLSKPIDESHGQEIQLSERPKSESSRAAIPSPAFSNEIRRSKYPQFAGREWTVEMAMGATAIAFITSVACNLAVWKCLIAVCLSVAGPPWVPPAGLAILPLACWWVRFVSDGAPYVTSDPRRVAAIRAVVAEEIRRIRENGGGCTSSTHNAMRAVQAADLGSGDGRLLVELIAAGADHAVGYEINPALVNTFSHSKQFRLR